MASEITSVFETKKIKEENYDGDWVMVHIWFFSDHNQLKMRTDINSGKTMLGATCITCYLSDLIDPDLTTMHFLLPF